MKRKYLFILTTVTILFVGCSNRLELDSQNRFPTTMTPNNKYFLDIERADKGINKRPEISTHKIKTLKKKQHKSIEDMSYGTNGASSKPFSKKYGYGIKKSYDIVAEDMPVNEFLYYIFQEILKNNFTIDPKIKTIKEKVTLKLNKRLSQAQLVGFLNDTLKSFGVEIVEKDNIYKAFYTKKPNDKTTDYLILSEQIRSDIPDDKDVAQYLECRYINNMSLISLATGIFVKNLTFKAITNQNGIIVYGKYNYIKRLINFKKIIDRPFMKDKKTTLIYFDYIKPSEFKKQFNDILSYQNLNTNNKNSFKLLPLDKIHALMVITSEKKDLQFLLRWKNKLDSYQDNEEKQETYFYKTKYRSVKEIYSILSSIISGNVPQLSQIKKTGQTIQNDNKKEFVKTEKADKKTTLSPINLSSAENGKKQIKIIPDKERNVLIIKATPSEYRDLLKILKKVDTQSLQLLVEANIIEVTLKDDLQYGMEWFLKNRANAALTDNAINVSGKTNVGLGAGGFFGVVSSNYFNVMLNMFAKKNLINILSHPKILVLNGKTASIQVGESIPTLSSTLSNVANPENAVSTVTYSNTGVTLNVTPSVTANGVIMMKISQTISKGQANGLSKISSPIIVNRAIDTEIMMRDNQSVVMGGLIQQDVSDTKTKVPVLGDIPVIRNLFRSTSKSMTRTELVLVVKIHIIDNFNLLDEVQQQFSDILAENAFDDDDSVSVIHNTHAIHTKTPDLLVSPDKIDKYYNGELDKYCDMDEFKGVKMVNTKHKKITLKPKVHKRKKIPTYVHPMQKAKVSKHSENLDDLPIAPTYPVDDLPVSKTYTTPTTHKSIEDLPLAKTIPVD